MFTKFIGVTQEVSALIEASRTNMAETESDILFRVLPRMVEPDAAAPCPTRRAVFDIGEGAQVSVGDKLYLFLSETARKAERPDGVAEVRADGLYVAGTKIVPSKGSHIQPAMKLFQEKAGHRNDKGELISLSAWRQWYIVADGKWTRLDELKDPARAKRRGRSLRSVLTADELDL